MLRAMGRHRVTVSQLPAWLDHGRLLGPGAWTYDAEDDRLRAACELERDAAADLEARLRGVGLDGRLLQVEVSPSLSRTHRRRARTDDARRRRAGTPAFSNPKARVDEEGRAYLTPESLADTMARRCHWPLVLDAGCGAGGNSLAFARAGMRVVAVERDAARLELARHNAKIYGVADRIDFRLGDAAMAMRTWAADLGPQAGSALLFVDPPWGKDWDRARTSVEDFPLLDVALASRGSFAALWAKLPASFESSAVEGARTQAYFGQGEGDDRRVKFVVMELAGRG